MLKNVNSAKYSTFPKNHRTVHSRSYKCITNYPKHIPKTPKSTFKFDLDLIFQGHFDRQSSKTLQHSKNLKITLFSSKELQYLILVDCLYCHKTHIIVVLISWNPEFRKNAELSDRKMTEKWVKYSFFTGKACL